MFFQLTITESVKFRRVELFSGIQRNIESIYHFTLEKAHFFCGVVLI